MYRNSTRSNSRFLNFQNIILFLIFFLSCTISIAQPGKDGAFIVTGSNTVLNRYVRVTGNVIPGATTVTVDDITQLYRDGITVPTGFSISTGSYANNLLQRGDLVMLYQSQGATITTTNGMSYGTVTNKNGAGSYEFAYVESVSGNTITLQCGAKLSYSVTRNVQLVRVPQYTTLTVNSSASIVPIPWGDAVFGGLIGDAIRRRGGFVSIMANSIVNNGSINSNQAGFRGGIIDNNTSTSDDTYYTDFVSTSSSISSEKGESIAGFSSDYDGLGGRYGRGAPANGGGGGNAHNTGGGGGANGGLVTNWRRGAGVMNSFGSCGSPGAWSLDPDYIENGNALTNSSGGGRGGYSFTFSNLDACTVGPSYPAGFISAGNPSANVLTAWTNDRRDAVGGLGGRPVQIANSQNEIFFGGGGGAGDGNNNANSNGGNGGGAVVLFVSNNITGSGTIQANGQAAPNTAG